MRRLSLRSLSLAFAGLGLIVPSAASAGEPHSTCAACSGVAQASHSHTVKAKHSENLCSACATKLALASNMPVSVGSSGTCSACSAKLGGPMPGYASVGGPIGGGAPGLATVGSPAPMGEPAPIGVMRTDFRSATAPGTFGAGAPGAARTAGAGVVQVPYAQPGEIPPSLYAPQAPRNHRILSRVIGLPDLGRRRAEAETRRRESHAMTSYGPQSAPSELPASMVYGGGR